MTTLNPADPELMRSPHADASRIGRALEQLVAASCVLASGGELNVSTALVDDEGVDLVFHRRGGVRTLAVQVKSRTRAAATVQRGLVLADVRSETFRARPDFYVMVVVADTVDGTYGPVWLVPSEDFARLSNRAGRHGRLRITASLGQSSRDKWSSYRVERPDLPSKILEILRQLEEPPGHA